MNHSLAVPDSGETLLTTAQAARVLGISLSTVQVLARRGLLAARSTPGGHRRISRHAIDDFLNRTGPAPQCAPQRMQIPEPDHDALRILVIDDQLPQRKPLRMHLESCNFPTHVRMNAHGADARLAIAAGDFDVLLIDPGTPGVDAINDADLIDLVRADTLPARIEVLILGHRPAHEPSGDAALPPWLTVYPKPLCHDELRGHLRACWSRKLRAGAQLALHRQG